jgi:molybdenum cofactor cytidylyltransferase
MTVYHMFITAILLAAGESRRFGSNKLAHLYNGKPILHHTLDKLVSISVIDQIVVVVNPISGVPCSVSSDDVKRVVNFDYKQGMGTSLREGVKACSDNTDAYLIALADMPHVKQRTIEVLIEEYKKMAKEILIPTYEDQKGHPIIMSARFKEEILKLNQDRGARDVIKENESCVGYVTVEDKGVLLDVDVVGDIKA